jgi:hypothetical protein
MPYQTKAFAHIFSHQFLIMLTQKLEKEDGLQVVIHSGDATMFKKLKARIPQINAAMKKFNMRTKNTKGGSDHL